MSKIKPNSIKTFELPPHLRRGDGQYSSSGGGNISNYKVKLNATDINANYLLNKLLAGTNITITNNGDGTATIESSGALTGTENNTVRFNSTGNLEQTNKIQVTDIDENMSSLDLKTVVNGVGGDGLAMKINPNDFYLGNLDKLIQYLLNQTEYNTFTFLGGTNIVNYNDNTKENVFQVIDYDTGTSIVLFKISANGDVMINNLIGTGDRYIGADSNGKLKEMPSPNIPTGTANQTLVFDDNNTLIATNKFLIHSDYRDNSDRIYIYDTYETSSIDMVAVCGDEWLDPEAPAPTNHNIASISIGADTQNSSVHLQAKEIRLYPEGTYNKSNGCILSLKDHTSGEVEWKLFTIPNGTEFNTVTFDVNGNLIETDRIQIKDEDITQIGGDVKMPNLANANNDLIYSDVNGFLHTTNGTNNFTLKKIKITKTAAQLLALSGSYFEALPALSDGKTYNINSIMVKTGINEFNEGACVKITLGTTKNIQGEAQLWGDTNYFYASNTAMTNMFEEDYKAAINIHIIDLTSVGSSDPVDFILFYYILDVS